MLSVPFSEMDKIECDWTLIHKNREWHYHKFWIRVNSGTLRCMPENLIEPALNLTDTFPSMSTEALDAYRAMIYGKEVRWVSEEQVTGFMTLVDYMDSSHLLTPMWRHTVTASLELALPFRDRMEFARRFDFPEMLDRCASKLTWALKNTDVSTIRHLMGGKGGVTPGENGEKTFQAFIHCYEAICSPSFQRKEPCTSHNNHNHKLQLWDSLVQSGEWLGA